jgi:3-oxoacyl-[acyl-carrier protein] reductase
MDLQLDQQLFLVTGASSGFGKAIAEALLAEGAYIIAVARGEEKLQSLKAIDPKKVETLAADMTDPASVNSLMGLLGERVLTGAVINAGGPPAKMVLETTLEDWDKAYHTLLRWKLALTQAIAPPMMAKKYGRIIYRKRLGKTTDRKSCTE